MEREHIESREWLVQKRVEEAVDKVYQLVYADDMSAAESRLAWLRVINKMLESVAFDRQAEVTSEWLGLKRS